MPSAVVIVLVNATPLSLHDMLTVGERRKMKLRFPLIPPSSLQPQIFSFFRNKQILCKSFQRAQGKTVTYPHSYSLEQEKKSPKYDFTGEE
jgi:hypothetical protein